MKSCKNCDFRRVDDSGSFSKIICYLQKSPKFGEEVFDGDVCDFHEYHHEYLLMLSASDSKKDKDELAEINKNRR